jgi:ribosomal protein S18 acetylase RimI-like enzyme
MLSFQILPVREHQEDRVRELVEEVLCRELGTCDDLSGEPDLGDIGASYAPPGSRFLVAMIQGEVVGTAAIRRLQDGDCELKHLYVRDSHRRQGLASALVMGLLNFVKQQEYRRIWLEIRPYMRETSKVYSRYGFLPAREGETPPREGEFLAIRL